MAMLFRKVRWIFNDANPDSKIHGANMGPTWVLSAPDGPHVGPTNLALWEVLSAAAHALRWYQLGSKARGLF